MQKKYIAITVVIVAIAAIISILIYSAVLSGKPQATQSTGKKKYQQQFCLNAVRNTTAMDFAINEGVKCYRTDIAINSSEESYVSNMTSKGTSFLGILDYETVGAHPSRAYGCTGNCNWTLSEWNSSVSNAVLDYPEIHTWEIWNEPLVPLFMNGYENGSALNYYEMVKSAYTIIKKNDPNSTVVCFGGAELAFSEQEYQFYREAWDYGMSQYCDAISIHAYTGDYYNLSQSLGSGVTVYDDLNYTLNIYENLTHKPIWITETGIPSNNWTTGTDLSEQKQAYFLRQDFTFLGNHSFVQRIYWFNLIGGSATNADYGLLNYSTVKPKPAWHAFLYFLDNSTSR